MSTAAAIGPTAILRIPRLGASHVCGFQPKSQFSPCALGRLHKQRTFSGLLHVKQRQQNTETHTTGARAELRCCCVKHALASPGFSLHLHHDSRLQELRERGKHFSIHQYTPFLRAISVRQSLSKAVFYSQRLKPLYAMPLVIRYPNRLFPVVLPSSYQSSTDTMSVCRSPTLMIQPTARLYRFLDMIACLNFKMKLVIDGLA